MPGCASLIGGLLFDRKADENVQAVSPPSVHGEQDPHSIAAMDLEREQRLVVLSGNLKSLAAMVAPSCVAGTLASEPGQYTGLATIDNGARFALPRSGLPKLSLYLRSADGRLS